MGAAANAMVRWTDLPGAVYLNRANTVTSTPVSDSTPMGLLLFFLVVVLIATFGFWDTLAALMGAALLVVLIVLLGVGAAAVAGILALRRLGGG